MKHFTFAALAFAVALALSPAVSAQSANLPEHAVIAYVSAQRLSTETTVGKTGLARVRDLQQTKASDLRRLQETLESTRTEMAQTTESDARQRLQAQEQQQRTAVERAAVQAQSEIQALQREMAGVLKASVNRALPELLKGTDIQVVVQLESAVVWAAPGLDLTSALIERINTENPETDGTR